MISAGANHTCAVQGADVKYWGSNDSGRLGTGDSKNHDLPRPIVPVKFGM
jgi:alpha-tubulin suppressor-like RCC1 family protein